MLVAIKKGFSSFIGLLKNVRAEASKVVSIAIAILISGVMLPIALQQIYSANTSGWNSAVAITFNVLLPILGVLAVALLFFKLGVGK
jgi:hypothetical protein